MERVYHIYVYILYYENYSHITYLHKHVFMIRSAHCFRPWRCLSCTTDRWHTNLAICSIDCVIITVTESWLSTIIFLTFPIQWHIRDRHGRRINIPRCYWQSHWINAAGRCNSQLLTFMQQWPPVYRISYLKTTLNIDRVRISSSYFWAWEHICCLSRYIVYLFAFCPSVSYDMIFNGCFD